MARIDRGLSPRGRGKPPLRQRRNRAAGSIPAWAGETAIRLIQAYQYQVYPRVGGGNDAAAGKTLEWFLRGLSPRGRGKRAYRCAIGATRRSIPAWAGETPCPICAALSSRVYPRVGGGNCADRHNDWFAQGLSPRGRGKLLDEPCGVIADGSIPAWAGETDANGAVDTARTVYPRVGGGNYRCVFGYRAECGLSPRGRGKRHSLTNLGDDGGSIPAWAGETRRTRRKVR